MLSFVSDGYGRELWLNTSYGRGINNRSNSKNEVPGRHGESSVITDLRNYRKFFTRKSIDTCFGRLCFYIQNLIFRLEGNVAIGNKRRHKRRDDMGRHHDYSWFYNLNRNTYRYSQIKIGSLNNKKIISSIQIKTREYW